MPVLHDEHAAAEIDRDQHADDDAHADARAAAVVGARGAVAGLASEEAGEAPVEVAPHFIEIGRAVAVLAVARALRILRPLLVVLGAAIAVAPPPARVVDRKDGMRGLPVTPLVVVVHSVIHH